MGRSTKNFCDYFSHDAGMRNHKKIKSIRNKFGIAGYAIWCMILELLTGSDGNVFEYSDLELEMISGDFLVPADDIRNVIDHCLKIELLFDKDGFIHSESLDERLKPVYEKRGRAKDESAKQKRSNGKFAGRSGFSVTEMPDVTDNGDTEKPQTKVKESKVKESSMIVGNSIELTDRSKKVKSIDDRAKDFYNNLKPFIEKYDTKMLRHFYDYWTEKSTNGRKMRFEKETTFEISKRLARWHSNNDTMGPGKQNGSMNIIPPVSPLKDLTANG